MAATKPSPENTLTIRIDLGKDFHHTLEASIEKSLQVAQKKWGLDLGADDINHIVHHSFAQLHQQVSENARSEWDGGRIVNVIVTASRPGEVFLPNHDMSPALKTSLIKTKNGWEISNEEEDEDKAVRVLDFYEHYRNLILTMLDTAIFYGVGSYSTYSSRM